MTTVPVHPISGEYPAAVAVTERRMRVGWGSIMMGAVTAIGLQFIFTALGVALGVTLGTTSSGADGGDLGVMAFVWWLVTGTISLFVGGLIFGRALGFTRQENICIGAATMWAVVALFGFMVVWSGVGTGVAAATPLSMMAAQSGRSAAGGWDRASGTLTGLTEPGGPADRAGVDTADRAPAADRDGARVTAAEAKSATRAASWWSVVGLVVGVVATWMGAAAGAKSTRMGRPDTV